jgi:GR25 family glycosyltransferase involved in LPS biosynthesis
MNIICINLKERKDKHDKVLQLFKDLNLEVQFFYADKHKTSGRIGCFESHVKVIQNEYYKNSQYILIFEDDIVSTPSYTDNSINEIVNFLDKNQWCQYFQLGYTILPQEIVGFFGSKNLSNNIIKYNGNCAHAYILNRNGMEKVLNTWREYAYKKELDLDVYYKEIFADNGAAICPILFDQNFCETSDNDSATSSYYYYIRKISCIQYNYSFLYWLSVIRVYMSLLIALFCSIVAVILYFTIKPVNIKLYKKYFFIE